MRNGIKNNKHYFIIIFSVCFLLSVFVSPIPLYAAGEIWVWGNNTYGECNVPMSNSDYKAIAAGADYSLGLKQDGSIVAWGKNYSGQCNVPFPNTGFKAIAGGNTHSLGLKQDGSIVAWGDNGNGKCNVPEPNTDFTAVVAGFSHSLGLKTDGSIVAWGYNGYGECNVPKPNTGFVAIACGDYQSLGLKHDGSIVAWGYNDNGECNVPSPNTSFIAITVRNWHSFGLKQNGSIVAWGDNTFGECNVPLPNTNFVAVAAGGDHSLGLKSNIAIARCTVTAGKTKGQDAFSASGAVDFPADLDFNHVNNIDVSIISLTDGASIYTETVDSSVVKGKFKYTHKIPRGGAGAITSLVIDSQKNTFSINAQNVDLTGLACPVELKFAMGSYELKGHADETIVNGKKTLIPTRLMRTYKDTLVVNKVQARHNSKKATSDMLSVTGDIAVINTDVNLCNEDVNFIWGIQTLRFPKGSFKASGTGHLFKGSMVICYVGDWTATVKAQVDMDKATFTLSSNGAITVDAASDPIAFGILFADFNETVVVNRVTGRSW
jgi:hypothetical protein